VIQGGAVATTEESTFGDGIQTWRDEPALELKYVKAKDNGAESDAKQAWDLKPPAQRFREYLLGLVCASGPDACTVPIRPLQELKDEVDRITGGPPDPPQLGDKIVAAIKWVDGTVIDSVRQSRCL
jgi:hypothetical protein